jgi:hypothetical protein
MLDSLVHDLENGILHDMQVALSLSCAGENHRMAAMHLKDAIHFHDLAASAFELGLIEEMKQHKKSAKLHQFQAFEYSKIAERIVSNLSI